MEVACRRLRLLVALNSPVVDCGAPRGRLRLLRSAAVFRHTHLNGSLPIVGLNVYGDSVGVR